MKKQLTALIAGLLLMGSAAYAGKESHGGDGLRILGDTFLLDLVEAGVEGAPYFDPNLDGDPSILKRLEKIFVGVPVNTKLLAKKITEIQKFDALFAEGILVTAGNFHWRWANSALLDVKDEDSSLDYPTDSLVQLAIRRSPAIMIDRRKWQDLNEGNQTALIMHEILYAMLDWANQLTTADGLNLLHNFDSKDARFVTGFLFSPSLQNLSRGEFYNVIGKKYPTLSAFKSEDAISRVFRLEGYDGYIVNPFIEIDEVPYYFASAQADGRYLDKMVDYYCERFRDEIERRGSKSMHMYFMAFEISDRSSFGSAFMPFLEKSKVDGGPDVVDLEVNKKTCRPVMREALLKGTETYKKTLGI